MLLGWIPCCRPHHYWSAGQWSYGLGTGKISPVGQSGVKVTLHPKKTFCVKLGYELKKD